MSTSLRYHKNKQSTRTRIEWLPLSESLFKKLYREISRYDVYSDTVASNIWAYMGRKARVALGSNGISLRLVDDYSKETYYTVLAGSNAREVVTELVRSLKHRDNTLVLRHVSSETTQNLRGWKAVTAIKSDIDNHDYVYSVDRLIDFDNRRLRRKGKEIAKTRVQYPNLTFKVGTQKNKDLVHDAIGICTRHYLAKKDTDPEYWNLELQGTRRLLRQKTATMVIVVAYHGEVPVGFNINEPLHNNFYLGHKGKADRHIKGLSFYLEHESAKHMKERYGSVYLNNMMDLGIEGLRAYKKSWGPLRMIRKYTVTIDLSKV